MRKTISRSAPAASPMLPTYAARKFVMTMKMNQRVSGRPMDMDGLTRTVMNITGPFLNFSLNSGVRISAISFARGSM